MVEAVQRPRTLVTRQWLVELDDGSELLVTVFCEQGSSVTALRVAARIDSTRWGPPLPARDAL